VEGPENLIPRSSWQSARLLTVDSVEIATRPREFDSHLGLHNIQRTAKGLLLSLKCLPGLLRLRVQAKVLVGGGNSEDGNFGATWERHLNP
jgi:hypothetical protein